MPILDMPLKELLVYKGMNECPADLDAFWDEGIAEMEALGTDYELVPAYSTSAAECYDMYFTGVGGARIHAIFIRPKHIEKPVPAVAEFHGYTGDCGSFRSKLCWAAAGMCAAALDCRGQGGRSEDNGRVPGNTHHGHIIRGLDDADPRKLYYRSVYLDTAQLVRILMAMDIVDETRVGAYGGSQGGGLTLACAALSPKLNRAAPQYPFLSDYRRVWDMDLAKDAYAELAEYFRHFDPLHEREAEIFTRLGYIDVHNMAHRIRARVRMYTGLMDNICPPSTQFAAYNNILSEKDYQIYPDFGHEAFPLQEDDVMKFMLEM
ncbi:MAG: acetylxylan esterase [Candidatus Faecivicinus sp.]